MAEERAWERTAQRLGRAAAAWLKGSEGPGTGVSEPRGLSAALVDAAAVVASWGAMLLTECVAVVLLWPAQFTASWEYGLARRLVLPIAFAMIAPAALGVVAAWELAMRAARGGSLARTGLVVLAGGAAAALAYGVSGGRHFAAPAVRAGFVTAFGDAV